MTTLSHEPATPSWPTWRVVLSHTELWASLAIVVMWLSVLFTAIYGPNVETSSSGGSDSATIPSTVFVAFFAFLATWVVAKYAYRRNVEHKH